MKSGVKGRSNVLSGVVIALSKKLGTQEGESKHSRTVVAPEQCIYKQWQETFCWELFSVSIMLKTVVLVYLFLSMTSYYSSV